MADYKPTNYNSYAWRHNGKDEVVDDQTHLPAKAKRALGDQCLVLSDSGNSNKPVWYVHDGDDWVVVWKAQ